ncbi:ubiquitin carboxyl-terminal hydrolase 24-like [Lingula anatina]|uniref:ubiquitinyl hydrolase 1 n=1 Tax=Lingula anatina TaxID=7574 RepID=A0A1S3JH12_LINAN|nr:ubiquitin carboxyl-terminal hydrolase 24-like [Lingula anatina]|eukprot:XP_013409431.2 ubiquitin carboxyl-terminal hydrolase 24-like [Lingula anatina]
MKNKNRKADKMYWEEKLGEKGLSAISPQGAFKEPYGWLTNLINRFAFKGGFHCIEKSMKKEDLDAPAMAALFHPFGQCAEFLNEDVVKPLLANGLERVIQFVQGLSENDLKDKRVGSVCDLLATVKLICLEMWKTDVSSVDELRLEIVLRMIKSPNFNARMNALKEVSRLIEDATATKMSKIAIHADKVQDWLEEKNVLSLALEGNIDQDQYCEKIKGIVDFLGTRLSLDEIEQIWKIQHGRSNHVVDNIHTIMAAAAVKFNPQQLDNFVILVQKSWQVENDKMKERLLSLIGRIGKDARVPKTTTRVLELLWDLAHVPSLTTNLIEQALGEHLVILSDAYSVREQVKKNYLTKCVEDIKKGVWVLPALKQLLHISKNIAKQTFSKADRGILYDLNKTCDTVKLVTNSLVKCHKLGVDAAKAKEEPLQPDTVVDGRYTHEDYVSVHLEFLQFTLQEGALYLSWHRARDIWDTLVANPEACNWDKEVCFEWFTKGISDLEAETQESLFQKELLKLDPCKMTEKGFRCWKFFFESVNMYQNKLKKQGTLLVVEKSDLIGLDYLWETCLNITDEDIAQEAIDVLLHMSYISLVPKLKKDPVPLHRKFIEECYGRLEGAMITIGGSAIFQAFSTATKTLTAAVVPEVASVPSPSRSAKLLNIERLLSIAERYILTVEELHMGPRTILPHGASFQGHPLNLYVSSESPKHEFTVTTHSNERLVSVRQKIAMELKCSPEQVQIVANDKMLTQMKDQKLMHQLNIEDQQTVCVRTLTGIGTSGSGSAAVKEPPPSYRSTFDLEQEKTLPGVVMASGGQVFDMLYQMAELEEPKIMICVRNLLKLIPTDPSVSDALDSIGQRPLRQPSPEASPSPAASPKNSPRKAAVMPAPLTSPKSTPKDVLRGLFDASSPDMNPFRVLYNLEVLSSKLMPTCEESGTLESAKHFCDDFLNGGGLNLVVNLLQKEAITPDVDYKTRQGCYAIGLRLLRYLLCGQTATGDSKILTLRRRHSSTGASLSAAAAARSSPVKSTSSSKTAAIAIQTMSNTDFTETVSCFMRVTWAAAAGRLHLASAVQPIRESSSGRRSRQSSTGSTASNSSDDSQSLYAGVCAHQTSISNKDVTIAKEALELLVTCLQLRSQLIASFYNLPCIGDFIIDVLVGCPDLELRKCARDQFYKLSKTSVVPQQEGQQTPHHFLLQVLLKARLPFWVPSSSIRGSSQRLLSQCTQYFELRCSLLEMLSVDAQKKLQINPTQMLEDEIAWLGNFNPSEQNGMMDTDNILLEGHLNLIRTLFTCDGVEKRSWGKDLLKDLLNDFLFPSSKHIIDEPGPTNTNNNQWNSSSRCGSPESRVAAYQLLVELANECAENLQDICRQLLNMHHRHNPDTAQEWEFLPPVESRASCGFVGLKNGGATCYMNSVIQLLYMVPGIPEYILGIDDENLDEESVFYQIQHVFGNLMESKLQYNEPEKFWKVFKLWGQTVNIREQQDAFDFFTALIDQLDEHLKKIGRETVFKRRFQGIFSDQKICRDCPHRYEREEAFYALNLTVKNTTLQDSLDQFVKGELLEGENAYFCEKCGEKRDTVKRLCIKALPPLLCIQLKRFGYDWEANRALKFDDYFQFPWVLDMEPYTEQGMSKRESVVDLMAEVPGEDSDQPIELPASPLATKAINYELVGVIVHSGQANAGHYYSFIKDRRGNVMSNPNRGKWFKFNDTVVEEFEMTDAALEAECFGGTYKAKIYDQSNSYPEERLRYWSGYLLFYERIEEMMRTPVSAKKSRVSKMRKSLQGLSSDRDSFVELTELVCRGDHQGIFTDKMPARIQQQVKEENLRFMKNRDVYSPEYFRFIRELVMKNSYHTEHPCFPMMSLESLQLGVQFLIHTYLRTKKQLRCDMDEWIACIETLVHGCKSACDWLIEYLASEEGAAYVCHFLLKCPTREIRIAFGRILERTMRCYFEHGGTTDHICFNELIENLLLLLGRDVPENCKQCTQYFRVLSNYAQMGTMACQHLFSRNAFQRMIHFLLGPAPAANVQQESIPRKWSSMQSRDFGPLHTTLAILITNCDIASFRTEEVGNHPAYQTKLVQPDKLLDMLPEVQEFVFGKESGRYLREVVMAVREIGGSIAHILDMCTYCSFCNATFSMTLLKNIMSQYASAPSSELKSLFVLLMQLLTLEDPLQLKRIQCTIDGYIDEENCSFEGMLGVIKCNHASDSRRSYQCIKFLVNLANKCPLARDYLVQTPSKWQWAVNWLKRKMQPSEFTWSSTSTITTSSNEDSDSKTFQRTMSAQDTLAEATALLTELEAQESEMDTNTLNNEETREQDSNSQSKMDSLDEVDF